MISDILDSVRSEGFLDNVATLQEFLESENLIECYEFIRSLLDIFDLVCHNQYKISGSEACLICVYDDADLNAVCFVVEQGKSVVAIERGYVRTCIKLANVAGLAFERKLRYRLHYPRPMLEKSFRGLTDDQLTWGESKAGIGIAANALALLVFHEVGHLILRHHEISNIESDRSSRTHYLYSVPTDETTLLDPDYAFLELEADTFSIHTVMACIDSQRFQDDDTHLGFSAVNLMGIFTFFKILDVISYDRSTLAMKKHGYPSASLRFLNAYFCASEAGRKELFFTLHKKIENEPVSIDFLRGSQIVGWLNNNKDYLHAVVDRQSILKSKFDGCVRSKIKNRVFSGFSAIEQIDEAIAEFRKHGIEEYTPGNLLHVSEVKVAPKN